MKLRELRAFGFRFRRQAPIGRYIVDFVSYGSRVVIEVDGG
jgi:very-short-patch-repair endonuclease